METGNKRKVRLVGANHTGERVVILEVAYGKWWSVPLETSGEVFAQYKEGLLGQ